MPDTQFHALPDGRRIAFRHTPGAGPALVFLSGYKSDMAGGKAQALFGWAAANGRACLLLDYSGCGESSGDFAQGTLSRWRDEVLALIQAQLTGPVVLVGSSMGGWIMAMIAKARPEMVAGMVGIAAAPDFTDWGFTMEQKLALLQTGRIEAPNDYGDRPTVTTRAFWASGEANRVLVQPIAWGGPARLLHGQKDKEVPWEHAPRLAAAIRSDMVQTLLVKDAEHRFSREQDLALIVRALEEVLALCSLS